MCAIKRHPDSSTRYSLTHTLFNLIKHPDEQQTDNNGNISVTHTKSVDCLLLNHAESLQDLYLILSIVLQLIEDFASVVRDAATRNLAMLLPIFPNVDKYFKVEELTFQLICDPSGVVLESTLKELVPAVIKWGNNLGHAGVLGAPGKSEQLSGYLRRLLLEDTSVENPITKHTHEIINAIHFIWSEY
ncbi:hypothetical protein Lal_00043001 [Lupinus albus]|nr:hypothetical protein Lal_00043001 [Lupinus albus]